MLYKNVLLIDDDEDDQEIFLTAMKEISNTVNCFALNNAEIALQKLESKQLFPDVIFLDLNMPVMNGQQFLTELKKKEGLNKIPVIIFSTSSNLQTIKETKALGAHDFITKPEKYTDLKVILRAIIK